MNIITVTIGIVVITIFSIVSYIEFLYFSSFYHSLFLLLIVTNSLLVIYQTKQTINLYDLLRKWLGR